MGTQIAGYVLRARDRHITARFYSELGLNMHEHQHGGPMHYEMGPLAPGCVVEVYKSTDVFSHDALMLNVDSISDALEIAARYGIKPTSAVREMTSARFVYITDPDGRMVLLIETTS
jgi:predicted enzyme related to lactoylglutathione lyase